MTKSHIQLLSYCANAFPVLTHPMLGSMVPGCCHAAVALVVRLGASLGIEVIPVPVGVDVLNGVAAQHYVGSGKTFDALPDSERTLLTHLGARSVKAMYEKREGEAFDRGGHLVALIPSLGLLVDPTVQQFSQPRMGIRLTEMLVANATVEELKRATPEAPLGVWVGAELCLYHYEPRATYWRDSPGSDYNDHELLRELDDLVRRHGSKEFVPSDVSIRTRLVRTTRERPVPTAR